MSPDETFRAKAPAIMKLLMADFGVNEDSAAAIVGNLGHESLGFTAFQEFSPTVKGSRGGYGWAQWTGPRRVAFETYCKRNSLDPKSDKANYGFLFVELAGPESASIRTVKTAVGLDAKVVAFEKSFLRAGIKHYPERQAWARKAIAAYDAQFGTNSTVPAPVPQPPKPVPPVPPQPPIPATPPAWRFGWVAALIKFILSLFGRK